MEQSQIDINLNLRKLQTSLPNNADLTTVQSVNLKTVEQIFTKFSVVWGIKWANSVNVSNKSIYTLALNEWHDSLKNLTVAQISEGITTCRNTLDYPPSIAQFKKACLGLLSSEDAYKLADNFITEKQANSPINAKKTFVFSDLFNSEELKYKPVRAAWGSSYDGYTREFDKKAFMQFYDNEIKKILSES